MELLLAEVIGRGAVLEVGELQTEARGVVAEEGEGEVRAVVDLDRLETEGFLIELEGAVQVLDAGTQMRGRVQDVSIGRDQPWLPRMKSNFVMTPSSSKVGFRMPMCGRKW